MSGNFNTKATIVPPRGGDGGSIDVGRFPLGAQVYEKGKGGQRKYDKWLNREGVIIPSTKNEVVYLTPALVESLDINGVVLFLRFADGQFMVANTHRTDKNGYKVDETGDNAVYKVAASGFVKMLNLMGDEYLFYPVSQITEFKVAIFNPKDREVMNL